MTLEERIVEGCGKEEEIVNFFKNKLYEINDYIEDLKFSSFDVTIEQNKETGFIRIKIHKKIQIPYFSKKCRSS